MARPADGIHKNCDDDSCTDGAAQVDAGQQVDLAGLDPEVIVLYQAAAAGQIEVVFGQLADELGGAVG